MVVVLTPILYFSSKESPEETFRAAIVKKGISFEQDFFHNTSHQSQAMSWIIEQGVFDEELYILATVIYGATAGKGDFLEARSKGNPDDGDNPKCLLYAVDCDGSHVKSLSFDYEDLTGTIAREIGYLAFLEELNIHSKDLKGSIPSSMGMLSRLEGIWLADNKLTGTIPSELGNLSELRALALPANKLTGTIPSELGQLSQLGHLNLGDNKLTGSLPSEIGNLSPLESLVLTLNKLTGPIPSEMCKLSKLEHLYLGGNKLTDPTKLSEICG
jgi:hypothetical protein